MEDKPKKRGRQPKAVKESIAAIPIEQEPDQMPVEEPLQVKGGKRKVNFSGTMATERPQRKVAGKKSKETVSEQTNGLEAGEPVELLAKSNGPVKKSRSTKKNVAVDQSNGVESEERNANPTSSEESNGVLEQVTVVAKNGPVKKGRGATKKDTVVELPDQATTPVKEQKGRGATKKDTVVELPEQATTPVKEQKAKGRKTVAKDTKKVNGVGVKAEPEKLEMGIESPLPTKRGKAKTVSTKAAVPEEPEDSVSPPKPKGRGKGKDGEAAAKKKKEEAKSQPTVEPAVSAKPNARGKKKATAVENITPEVASAPESPAKTVELPKRGRTRNAVVMSEADGESETDTSKTKRKPSTEITNADIPTITQRKRAKPSVDYAEEETVPAKESKKAKVTAPKMNKCATDYGTINFALEEAKPWTLKISSWNVAGLRGWVGKGGLEYIDHEQPDILCVQETKCTEDQLPDEARHIKGYHPYWLCKPGGYAGVAIYSKKMPIHVVYGLGDEEQDQDGRLLTAEYEKFYLVCVYVPNAGKKLVTLPKRMRWDEKFHQYLRDLDSKKPVILCGDMNVAHEEIDLANPKTNRKNAGFTQEERDGMSNLLSFGFVDTFRKLYPDQKGAYTFWTYMGGARAKNVGWRLDYFITSERLVDKVTDNVIRTQVYGSDHCPVTLFLKI